MSTTIQVTASVNLLRSYFITTSVVTTMSERLCLLTNAAIITAIRDRTILVERFTAAAEWIVVSVHHFEKCGRTVQSYPVQSAFSDKGLHCTALEIYYSEAAVHMILYSGALVFPYKNYR